MTGLLHLARQAPSCSDIARSMRRLPQLQLRHVIVEFNLHAYRPKRFDMMQLSGSIIAQPALEHANDAPGARLGALLNPAGKVFSSNTAVVR